MDQLQPPWRDCAERVYRFAADSELLPLTRGDLTSYVAPRLAQVLDLPTQALRAQQSALLALYRTYGAHMPKAEVQLPEHVRSACLAHSGLCLLPVDDFLSQIIRSTMVPPEVLSPILLALAEHADSWKPEKKGFCLPLDKKEQWAELLADVSWVPLRTGGFSLLRKAFAFAPAQPHLNSADLGVIASSVANLDGAPAAAVCTAIAWGLKTDLSWRDVLQEAQSVAALSDRANIDQAASAGRRLLQYIRNREANFMAKPSSSELAELQTIRFVFASAPCTGSPTSSDALPRGPFALRSPSEVLDKQWQPLVWATTCTAAEPATLTVQFQTCTDQHLVEAISEQCRRGGSDHAAHHLLLCCQELAKRCGRDKALLAQRFSLLLGRAFLPSKLDAEVRFVEASRVALRCLQNLRPHFDRLPDAWLAGLDRSFFDAAGVAERLSAEVIFDEITELANRASGDAQLSDGPSGVLGEAELVMACKLVNQLCSLCNDTS